eukprot:XP_017445891.1 PREDICTED: uncharacterized protein LOC103691392 isoform X1 [Rattus norvegicus]
MERSRRHCPGRASSRPPGRRPLGVFALRSGLAPSLSRHPLQFLSSSFGSSASLFSSSSSFLSSSCSSSSSYFLHLLLLSYRLLLHQHHSLRGTRVPADSRGPLCLCCGPLDPKPASPELMGLKHRRTHRFLHALSSAEVVPWRPAPGSLRWLQAPGEDEGVEADSKRQRSCLHGTQQGCLERNAHRSP